MQNTPSHPVPDTLAAVALFLFDATVQCHALGTDSQAIIALAAGLYHAPLEGGSKKKLRSVRRLAQHHAPDLSVDAQEALAAVLALARRLIKRKDLDRFELALSQQHQVLSLAALLRIAAVFDPDGDHPAHLDEVQFAEEQFWLVVRGADARGTTRAIAALEAAGRLWEKLGNSPVTGIDPEEARLRRLPFPKPAERIGLTPDDPLSEAARKVLCFHFARVLQHEPGTRLGEDIEALHDMRVATRRLRAAFEVFADAFEPGYLKPYLKGLRATGRALGKVRDLDVFMEKAQHYLDSLPSIQPPEGSTAQALLEAAPDEPASSSATPAASPLAPLFNHWQAERDQARTEMLDFLNSPVYAAFKRQFNIFLHTPGAGARYPLQEGPVLAEPPGALPELIPVHVRELAPMLIYTRLAAVRAHGPYILNAPIERLHALRIEFKKLRYTVEYFQEVLGSQVQDVIANIKQLQDHLGDMNDAQVASLLLSNFLQQEELRPAGGDTPPEELPNLDGVRDYLAFRQAERQRLQETFEPAWHEHFARARFRRHLAEAVAVL